ncbi:sigma-70 family RNA polymerase sigma factor [Verrucomicrobiales bacterium]|nr:sigma-70 family RNA polymerase sigma factor [Verrucomicrobiales bacterium]
MSDLNSEKHDSFLRLYAAHEPALRGFVRSLVPTRNDTSDVIQEIAIILWKKFEDLDSPSNFRPWAFGVARYEVLAWRRDKARDKHLFSEDMSNLLASEAEALADKSEDQRRALEFCLKKLPGEREVLMRRAYDGETQIDSLASEMNRTAMSLYKVLHRLRMKLVTCTESFLRKERTSS